MEHDVREDQGRLIVSLRGEVDLENSPKAREILLQCVQKQQGVVVDLSEVNYIDSSGVASLVEAFQTAKQEGNHFVLAAVNPAVMRVLELARLHTVFTIHETLAQGLEIGSDT